MGNAHAVRLPPTFDELRVGIMIYDSETGDILDGNERSAELYGYPIEKLRTMGVKEYTAPSTKFTREAALERIRAAAEGEPQAFNWQIKRGNGELRWVCIHLTRTTLDGTDCVLAEIEDITEYRARERRLRLLSRIVRHNLRNKTTVLMGYGDRIKAAIENEDLEEDLEMILEITSEIGTLSESVRQIEQIAEPDATQRSPTNLRPIVEAHAEEFKERFPDVEMTVTAPADVWTVADKGVNYAISHAIENAIEHNDRETPKVTVSVTEDSVAERGVIKVIDNGPTIPEIEIDVLKDDVETTSTYHGTGVGLWVMQWCVDSLGGELRFAEQSPRGNVVEISLPKPEDR